MVLANSYKELPKWSILRRKGVKEGFEVFLINQTKYDYKLVNVDHEILIYRQAFFENEWVFVEPIKKDFSPWCGNSYMTSRVIKSNDYFSFLAPCIDGNIKMKMRFSIIAMDRANAIPIVSNEFEGWIHLGLLGKKSTGKY